jgi:hypothetical protein
VALRAERRSEAVALAGGVAVHATEPDDDDRLLAGELLAVPLGGLLGDVGAGDGDVPVVGPALLGERVAEVVPADVDDLLRAQLVERG